jgi:hypothetical protein
LGRRDPAPGRVRGVGERWGLFTDITYVGLSDSAEGELGFGRLDVEIEKLVVEGGLI